MSDDRFIETMIDGSRRLNEDFKKAIRHFEVGDEDAMEECGDGLAELAEACRHSPVFSVIMMKLLHAGFETLFTDEESVREMAEYCRKIKRIYQ